MNLRPYQENSLELIRDCFRKQRRRVILCLPTGAGKTVVFSTIVKMAQGKRVLILTDRIELLTQAGGTLSKMGIEWQPIASGKKIDFSAGCHVAMVETFARRLTKYPQLLEYDLVIIDEAHRGNFKKVLELIPSNVHVIGATATPVASQKKNPLLKQWQDIVCPVQIPDLVDMGFLVDCITYSAARIDKTVLKKKLGEYTDQSLMDAFDRREVYAGVIEKYRLYAAGRKAICFNVNIAHSKTMCAEFNSAGIDCEHVDGTTPEAERLAILTRFKKGVTQVLCNVGIVTTGYDEPSVSCIIVNRATTSVPLWLQMCGRGSRIHPESGKRNFVILDMGENYRDLGLWNANRDWIKGFWNPKKEGGTGVAPVRSCPGCEAILAASVRECPYCGHVHEAKHKEVKHVDFVRVDGKGKPILPEDAPLPKPPQKDWPNMEVPEMVLYVKTKTYKAGWAIRVIKNRNTAREKALQELSTFARLMGYSPGWVKHQTL